MSEVEFSNLEDDGESEFAGNAAELTGEQEEAIDKAEEEVGETLSGWLQKLQKGYGGTKRYRKCWFVLSTSPDGTGEWTLSHYEHGTNMREFVGAERLAQGERKVTDVSNIQKILFVGNKGNKFEIIHKDKRPGMVLRAANVDVCKRWVYAILRIKDELDKPDEPKSPVNGGKVAPYSLKPEKVDKRRERESVKMTNTFLNDSAVFMESARSFATNARANRNIGKTLGRQGRGTRGTRAVPGVGGIGGARPPGAKPVSQHSSFEDDDVEEFDSLLPPPPGGDASHTGGLSSVDDIYGTKTEEGEFDQESYAATAREKTKKSGGGGLFCKKKASSKPKLTAKLHKVPEGFASPGDKVRLAEPPIAKKYDRTLEKQKPKGKGKPEYDMLGASATVGRAEKKRNSFKFLSKTAERKANTIVGDETLKRKKEMNSG
ncbi:cGMP-dependent protein kinase, partial [Durusdinium trenchii]